MHQLIQACEPLFAVQVKLQSSVEQTLQAFFSDLAFFVDLM